MCIRDRSLGLSAYSERPKDRDILVRIIVPKKNAKFSYQSVRITQTDIPVLTCASVKDENGYRFAIGARPARAQIYSCLLYTSRCV